MEKGFTLIELIISIFILSVAIIGVFAVFSMVVILTSDTADRLTGAYLAQEGIEIVRNIRDNNWLKMDAGAGFGWLDGMIATNGIDCTLGCEADYTTGTDVAGATALAPWSEPGRSLNLIEGSYAYGTTDAVPSKFKRKIKIEPINSLDYAAKVSVEVSWDLKATVLGAGYQAGNCTPSNCITAKVTLYDWYNYK